MYKGTLCVLVVLAIVLYSTNALPTTKTARKARQASDTDTLTDKFDSLINNLNEIKENVSVTDEDKINIILREFNFTCRTFTFVMMLKLQLQDYLFQVAVNESEISDILHKLTHLETAAAILNDIAVSTTQHPCVVFGPDEYEHIYNDTLAKNMISNQEGESGKINIYKLLHKLLDDAGQVLDLIIFAVNQ